VCLLMALATIQAAQTGFGLNHVKEHQKKRLSDMTHSSRLQRQLVVTLATLDIPSTLGFSGHNLSF